MVLPNGSFNLETAERITHVMRKTKQELHYLQEMGFYRDTDLGEPSYDLDEVEKKIAEQMGFRKVASGPFVRSSYHARDMAETECD